jgi:hypothetical protein
MFPFRELWERRERCGYLERGVSLAASPNPNSLFPLQFVLRIALSIVLVAYFIYSHRHSTACLVTSHVRDLPGHGSLVCSSSRTYTCYSRLLICSRSSSSKLTHLNVYVFLVSYVLSDSKCSISKRVL